jgi:uncharacterized DUF497 family protein
MEFEWDEAKADSNRVKHGIDFRVAIEIFDDPRSLTVIDPRSYGEERYQVVGIVRGRLLQVVCTMRGDACRIISARRASYRERTTYSLQARN